MGFLGERRVKNQRKKGGAADTALAQPFEEKGIRTISWVTIR